MSDEVAVQANDVVSGIWGVTRVDENKQVSVGAGDRVIVDTDFVFDTDGSNTYRLKDELVHLRAYMSQGVYRDLTDNPANYLPK